MSAPAVRTKPSLNNSATKELRELTVKLKDYVGKNFHDVGSEFAEEARKIHYSEVEPKNIKGTATSEELTSLKEEGIACLPIPSIKQNS